MARISTYQQDRLITDRDQLIGTDAGMIGIDGRVIAGTAGKTRNFSIGDLRTYFQSRSTEGGTNFATLAITNANSPNGHIAQLYTAYAINVPNTNVIFTLPTVGTDGEAVDDGAWIRFTFIGSSGGMIYAGSQQANQAAIGDRFMAGIAADGTDAADPHLLAIGQDTAVSFELIYVADTITRNGITAPVGWIIVN